MMPVDESIRRALGYGTFPASGRAYDAYGREFPIPAQRVARPVKSMTSRPIGPRLPLRGVPVAGEQTAGAGLAMPQNALLEKGQRLPQSTFANYGVVPQSEVEEQQTAFRPAAPQKPAIRTAKLEEIRGLPELVRQAEVEQMATQGPGAANYNDTAAKLAEIRDRVLALKVSAANQQLARSSPLTSALTADPRLAAARQQAARNTAALQQRAGMQPRTDGSVADLIGMSNRNNEMNNYARGSHGVRLSSATPDQIPARIEEESLRDAQFADSAPVQGRPVLRSNQTSGQLANEKARTAATQQRVAAAIKARQPQIMAGGGGGGGFDAWVAYQQLLASGASPNVAADIVDRQTRSRNEAGIQASQFAVDTGLKREQLGITRSQAERQAAHDDLLAGLKQRELYGSAYNQYHELHPDADESEKRAHATQLSGYTPPQAGPVAQPGAPPSMDQSARTAQRLGTDALLSQLGISPQSTDIDVARLLAKRGNGDAALDDQTLAKLNDFHQARSRVDPSYTTLKDPSMMRDLIAALTLPGGRSKAVRERLAAESERRLRLQGEQYSFGSY